MKKDKAVFYVCSVAFSVNIVLFFIKLYIGLRTNSISIYSDAVNNLFDSLSGLLTLVTLSMIIKNADLSTESTVRKSEQLFSFLMALAVAFTGFYFAYSSVERLMYPTPVWYTGLFLAVLIFTSLIKAGMFFFYKAFYQKTSSPVVRVMAYDSLLDFFITAVTVLTLYISGSGNFAFDAVFGIIISIAIIVSAFKLIISNAKGLINFVSQSEREALEEILSSHKVKTEKISYHTSGELTQAYLKAEFENDNDIAFIKDECKEKTGIEVHIVL